MVDICVTKNSSLDAGNKNYILQLSMNKGTINNNN